MQNTYHWCTKRNLGSTYVTIIIYLYKVQKYMGIIITLAPQLYLQILINFRSFYSQQSHFNLAEIRLLVHTLKIIYKL